MTTNLYAIHKEMTYNLDKAMKEYNLSKKNNNNIETPEIKELGYKVNELYSEYRNFTNKYRREQIFNEDNKEAYYKEHNNREKSRDNIITLGPYKISMMCMESLPCQHYVLLPDGKEKLMYSSDIDEMLQKNNLSHPHFNGWKKFQDERTLGTNVPNLGEIHGISRTEKSQESNNNISIISTCFSCK